MVLDQHPGCQAREGVLLVEDLEPTSQHVELLVIPHSCDSVKRRWNILTVIHGLKLSTENGGAQWGWSTRFAPTCSHPNHD